MFCVIFFKLSHGFLSECSNCVSCCSVPYIFSRVADRLPIRWSSLRMCGCRHIRTSCYSCFYAHETSSFQHKYIVLLLLLFCSLSLSLLSLSQSLTRSNGPFYVRPAQPRFQTAHRFSSTAIVVNTAAHVVNSRHVRLFARRRPTTALLGRMLLRHQHHVLLMMWRLAAGTLEVLRHQLWWPGNERTHHLELRCLRLRLNVLRRSAAGRRRLRCAWMVLRLVRLVRLARRRRSGRRRRSEILQLGLRRCVVIHAHLLVDLLGAMRFGCVGVSCCI